MWKDITCLHRYREKERKWIYSWPPLYDGIWKVENMIICRTGICMPMVHYAIHSSCPMGRKCDLVFKEGDGCFASYSFFFQRLVVLGIDRVCGDLSSSFEIVG